MKHLVITIRTKKKGFITAELFKERGYSKFYISPNNTEWASTFYLGPDKNQKIKAQVRKILLGHNYDVVANGDLVQAIQTCFVVNKRWFLTEFASKNSGTRRY